MSSPKLLDQVCDRIRLKHYSLRTEQAYTGWIRQFILFHGKRHPREMGKTEIEDFLSYLARERSVSASTQNQAKAALLFLYKEVLQIELPWLDEVEQAKRPKKLSVVLSQQETRLLLNALTGTHSLIGRLLQGGYDIHTVQELLRHKDVQITMIYTHVLNRGGHGVWSPLDQQG